MATIDLRSGTSYPFTGSNRVAVLDSTLDFSDDNAEASDTVQVFNIPANCLVMQVAATCVTAEGGTLTLDVGDADTATQYLSNFNGNSTGSTLAAATTAKFYPAAGVLQLNMDHAADAAVIRIRAVVVNLA